MGTTDGPGFELVLSSLKEFGLLLETDTKLPSVAGQVAGEPIRGSWWAHPRSHQIFAVLQKVADHKDVLSARLISGKVTFVHRKLWPDILSVGTAREAWQLRGLTPAARMLLKMIDQHRELRSDQLEWPAKVKSVKPGQAARELEKRLLIHTREFHTESGGHAKLLETWGHWTTRLRFKRRVVEVANAKLRLEHRLSILNERFETSAALPWSNAG